MATESQSKKPGDTRKVGDTGTVGHSGKVKVTLIRSPIKTKTGHRATVRGLGLRRLNHTVELEDTPAVRGMINRVSYLLKCED